MLGVRIAKDLVFQLSPDLYKSVWVNSQTALRNRSWNRGRHTLTSSNGALPTQTTAPEAPPASRLVNATSLAVLFPNSPSPKLIQLPASTLLPFASASACTCASALALAGSELRIRFVEV